MNNTFCYLTAIVINTQGEMSDVACWHIGNNTRRTAVVDVVFLLGFKMSGLSKEGKSDEEKNVKKRNEKYVKGGNQ